MNREQLLAELNKAQDKVAAVRSAEVIDTDALSSAVVELDAVRSQLSAFDAFSTPTATTKIEANTATRSAAGALLAVAPDFAKRAASGENFTVNLDTRSDVFTGATSGGLDIVPIDYVTPFDYKPWRPTTLLNKIPVAPTESDTIAVYVETSRVNSAAPVARRTGNPADFQAYAESSVVVTKQLIPVVKIGHYVRTDADSLADQGQLNQLIAQDLQNGVTQEILNELVAETDTVNGLTSIAVVGNGRAQNVTYTMGTDTNANAVALIEGIRKAKTLSETTLLPAEWVAMSPKAAEALSLAKSNTGFYLSGGPFMSGDEATVWGLPIVICHQLADNDAESFGRVLVGSSSRLTIFSRRQTEIAVSNNVNGDFLQDAIRIKASVRLGVSNRRPEAIVVVNASGDAAVPSDYEVSANYATTGE